MVRRSLGAGVLLRIFALSASALAGGVPRATLVQKADAVCAAETASVHLTNKPNLVALFAKPTPTRLRASASYYAQAAVYVSHAISIVFALGVPSEPASRATWNDWKTLTTRTEVPALFALAHATKAGDIEAFRKAIRVVAATSGRGRRDRRLLGIEVCDFPCVSLDEAQDERALGVSRWRAFSSP